MLRLIRIAAVLDDTNKLLLLLLLGRSLVFGECAFPPVSLGPAGLSQTADFALDSELGPRTGL